MTSVAGGLEGRERGGITLDDVDDDDDDDDDDDAGDDDDVVVDGCAPLRGQRSGHELPEVFGLSLNGHG